MCIAKGAFSIPGVFVLKLDLRGLPRDLHIREKLGESWLGSLPVSPATGIELKAGSNPIVLSVLGMELGSPLEVSCVRPSLGDFTVQSARASRGGRIL